MAPLQHKYHPCICQDDNPQFCLLDLHQSQSRTHIYCDIPSRFKRKLGKILNRAFLWTCQVSQLSWLNVFANGHCSCRVYSWVLMYKNYQQHWTSISKSCLTSNRLPLLKNVYTGLQCRLAGTASSFQSSDYNTSLQGQHLNFKVQTILFTVTILHSP